MKTTYYSLKIHAEEALWPKISEILGMEHELERHYWQYLVVLDDSTSELPFLHPTLDKLEQHEAALTELGIQKDHIFIHVDYEYDGQMNTEFEPQTLIRIGRYGISLTISCREVEFTGE